ncbi:MULTISPECIES: hypothetical protein [unclassified Pseudoalteromonas]|uniref:hypothetical protein n=1 Tax=unclassified Pseudoalteromonas TaxID=194690 RepID=UPI0005A5D572|nr:MULTISPECIES: hypothetical protein [unclassified Pseudoalteromonas]
MSSFKLNLALFCSILALVFSGMNLIQQNSIITDVIKEPTGTYSNKQSIALSEPEVKSSDIEVQYLLERIVKLETRLSSFSREDTTMPLEHSRQALETVVFSLIEKHKQKEMDELKAENPVYSVYEDLPKDYELRIKTDSEFANQVSNELKLKVLNDNLPAAERLAAISQLQMNMYILNKKNLEQYDYQAVEAILDMTNNMQDENLRLQALELVSRAPLVDERLSQSFAKMLEQEPNDYVKSLAAEGLMSQYFQSGSNPTKQKKIAQNLLHLYENTEDPKVKSILENTMGDERMLEDLNKLLKD